MIKAVDTLVPQEVPPGSGEPAVGKAAFRSERGEAGEVVFLRISRGMSLIRISKPAVARELLSPAIFSTAIPCLPVRFFRGAGGSFIPEGCSAPCIMDVVARSLPSAIFIILDD